MVVIRDCGWQDERHIISEAPSGLLPLIFASSLWCWTVEMNMRVSGPSVMTWTKGSFNNLL